METSKEPTLFFQSPEHHHIGDRVVLKFPNGNVSGEKFHYVGHGFPGRLSLSFGQIVALAGDFYGNCQWLGEAEQISDAWDKNPEASIQRFVANSDLLNRDTNGYLARVLSIMLEQEGEVTKEISDGLDIAQVFKRIGDVYDKAWGIATRADYLLLALCNWDHFGQDAINAYKAGHTAAIRQAKLAGEKHDEIGLRYAYFLEAFACHFLTDLFSTGHMRTPRRLLHKNGGVPKNMEQLMADDPAGIKVPFWKEDQCARAMHDEDCANGLWVRNAEGTGWPAYGDSQLFSAKGNLSFQAAVQATQAGIDEVWQTFQGGTAGRFRALDKTPLLGAMAPSNFAPLFKSDGAYLYVRRNIDDRHLSTYDRFPIPNVPWGQILDRISESGQSKNQLPLTMDLRCPTRVLHLSVTDDSNFSVSQYGTVYSQASSSTEPMVESWNMLSHTILSVPQSSGQTSWCAARKIDDCVYSIVGRVLLPSEDINAYHIGIKVTSDEVDLIWENEVEDGNSVLKLGNVWYGRFDADRDTLSMIKHWHFAGSPWKSKLELWIFNSGTSRNPTRKRTEWPSAFKLPPYTGFSIRLASGDASDAFVTAALDKSAPEAKTLWTFSTWKNNYSKLVHFTYTESLAEAAQHIIVNCGATTSTGNRVIRIFYGKEYSKPGNIRIDVLELSTSSVRIVSSSEFEVQWSGDTYLTWFLSDVDADGNLDLIGLVAADDGSLSVLALRSRQGQSSEFEPPVVSKITSDKGSLLTAPFMTPIQAHQCVYKYPGATYQVDSAIMMAFDNYGVIGFRLLRPRSYSGTLQYEIGGQLPAVAGQKSVTLGQVTRLFGNLQDHVGLFIEY